MMAYEKLEAWKACYALLLAVDEATRGMTERDPQLIHDLVHSALRAGGKLAFGAGTRDKRMFLTSIHQTAGYLSALAYSLSLARVMSLLHEETCARLDALRGRASFYTWQLLDTVITAPGADPT